MGEDNTRVSNNEERFARSYAALLSGRRATLAWLVTGSALSAVTFGVAMPLLILKIIDEGVVAKDFDSLAFYSALALLIFGSNAVVNYLIQLKRVRLRNDLVKGISLQMLDHFFRIPYRTILRNDRGYFISRIFDEVSKAVEPILRTIIELTVVSISILAAAVVVFYLSWRMAVMIAIAGPLFHFASRSVASRIRKASKRAAEEEAVTKGILERVIGAHPVVKVFGLHGKARSRYSDALARHLTAFFQKSRFSALFRSLGLGFTFSSAIVVLAASGYEVMEGRLSMGGMLAISNIYGRLANYAQSLVNVIPSLESAWATFERIFDFRSLAEKEPAQSSHDGEVVVREMGFAYNSEEVCRSLDLGIRKGERVLILGPNGSGKTTLARVLAGLLYPTSGLARIPRMKRVSTAFFPPIFIPGDVADNVGFPHLSEAKKQLCVEIAEALQISGRLGQDPQQLSAGQKQKVSVLRALLKEADLYIFDEPFSNVDADTKDRLFKTILEVTQGKSLVFVMHGDEQYRSEFDKVINLDLAGSHLSQQQPA